MVLLAVHTFTTLTSSAMHDCAPRAPLMWRVSQLMMKWIPPLCLISPRSPEASRVTTMRSPIPVMPSPIAVIIAIEPISVQPIAIAIDVMMPRSSTMRTFTPAAAVTITTRYGIIRA